MAKDVEPDPRIDASALLSLLDNNETYSKKGLSDTSLFWGLNIVKALRRLSFYNLYMYFCSRVSTEVQVHYEN